MVLVDGWVCLQMVTNSFDGFPMKVGISWWFGIPRRVDHCMSIIFITCTRTPANLVRVVKPYPKTFPAPFAPTIKIKKINLGTKSSWVNFWVNCLSRWESLPGTRWTAVSSYKELTASDGDNVATPWFIKEAPGVCSRMAVDKPPLCWKAQAISPLRMAKPVCYELHHYYQILSAHLTGNWGP